MADLTPPLLDELAPFLGSDIVTTFRLMAIAEEEIAAAKDRAPLQSHLIDGAFRMLCPRMALFGGRSPDLYRHHAREIIARVLAGEDTRPGTQAEVLCVLSESSMRSPLANSALALMEKLVEAIFPGTIPQLFVDDWEFREEWPGAADEVFATTARRITDDSRTAGEE